MPFYYHGLYFDVQLHISLFFLGFGILIASLNSFIFFLNQLTCATPSILKSNFPFSFSLMEQTERLMSKSRLNSVEWSFLLWEHP